MNRLPCPSAVVAAMLPLTPAGIADAVAIFEQSAGSNVTPGGSGCGPSRCGPMAVGATGGTLKSGPKLDLTSATLAMLAEESSLLGSPPEHAANKPAHTTTSRVLSIAVTVPAGWQVSA